MGSFDELKKFAADTAEAIADKSVEFAKIAADKTKAIARTTRLSTEIMSEKDAVKKRFAEIGKLYYQLHKDEPEEALAQLVDEITVSLDKIDAKKKEIEDLKSDNPDIEVEVIYEEEEEPASETVTASEEESAEEPAADEPQAEAEETKE